jgi:hypothetical protein
MKHWSAMEQILIADREICPSAAFIPLLQEAME